MAAPRSAANIGIALMSNIRPHDTVSGPFDPLLSRPGFVNKEFILREEVARFTDGLLTGKRLANLASPKARLDGEPTPPESVKIGRRVGYHKLVLVSWLNSQAASVEASKPKIIKRTRKVVEVVNV